MKNWFNKSLIGAFLIASIFAGILYQEYRSPLPADAKASFVGGSSCIQCHQEQHKDFVGSHHDRAMDIATEDTVLANFDGTTIEHHGVTSTVFKSADRFMVNTEGPDGTMQDFEVKMVFGYEPLQQYMVELQPAGKPDSVGQLQVLRLSWDVQKQEWFYLNPPDVNEILAPDDPLHWTGITQRWNSNCAICHSTNLQKNFDTLSGKYSTTFTDINVNCESCHGPGSLHVEIANRRRFFWDKNHGYGLVKLKTTSNLPQVESCAPCHSRRTEICSGHQAGKRFNDFFACQLLSDRIYHDDGQIRDEDYVYGSFIQSKMFHQGIKCTDCHDPHSVKVKFDDNRLCTSCHQHPAGKYDTPSHHRHKVGSTGALCVECHMPATTYMAIDSRRDHSIRVPRPDLSAKFGTPNACTACHIDKNVLPEEKQGDLVQYLDWISAAEAGDAVIKKALDRVDRSMADAFAQWYPESAINDKRSKYYEQLALGKSDAENSMQTLESLARDRTAPSIFRASAIESMAFGKDWKSDFAFLESSLADEDPKVVSSAMSLVGLEIQRAIELFNYQVDRSESSKKISRCIKLANPLLSHDSRRVRVEAARTIANVPSQLRSYGSINSSAFQSALQELMESLRVGNDLASNHMTLGNIFESDGQFEKAEDAYRTAISVQPGFAGPRSNLARLMEMRADEIRSQIIQSPRSKANVDLGKLIDKLSIDSRRLRVEENQVLKKDVQRAADLKGAHGLFYRYGLSCYLLGDQDSAEKYLVKANDLSPDNESYLLGLATFYNQQKKFTQALPFINRLIEVNSRHIGYQRLRDEALKGLE